MALRAVPIAAGVVADDRVAAILAGGDIAAKLRRAAGFDRGHRFQLAEAQMPGVGRAPGGAVAAEDVRNLKRGARHGPRRLSLGVVLLLLDQGKPVQGAHHLADRGGGPASAVTHEQGSHPHMKRDAALSNMRANKRLRLIKRAML